MRTRSADPFTFWTVALTCTDAGPQPRDHPHRLPVHPVEALEVDLALHARVVPPAAGRQPVGGAAGGREVGVAVPRVDADHQPVRATPLDVPEPQLERDVGAGVGAHGLAVEPHARAVVDRLEAHRPLERLARLRHREVLAVPADAADHRGRRVVPEVPHARHLHASPAGRAAAAVPAAPDPPVAGIEAEQPRAVHQVPARRTVVVERLVRRLVRGRRAARQRQEEQRGEGQEESQAAGHPRHENTAPGGKSRRSGGGHPHDASPAIGFEIASSSTPPPVSGPSRRACTHCTTGCDVPARQATRPVPVARVIVIRIDGR